MVACDGGQTLRGKLFHTDGTDTEQRKRADYFNVKELPNPEWVWADCFHGKQFVTSFVCVTVTHGAPFHQRHSQWMLRHTSLHTRRFSVRHRAEQGTVRRSVHSLGGSTRVSTFD